MPALADPATTGWYLCHVWGLCSVLEVRCGRVYGLREHFDKSNEQAHFVTRLGWPQHLRCPRFRCSGPLPSAFGLGWAWCMSSDGIHVEESSRYRLQGFMELRGVSIEVRAAVGNAGIILYKLAILSWTCWCKHAAFAMPSHGGCHGTSLPG